MAVPLDAQRPPSPEVNAFGSWLFPRPAHRDTATTRPASNPRKTDFNPWASMGSMRSATQDAELARRKAIDQYQAQQLFGQMMYFPGYEACKGRDAPLARVALCHQS